MIVWIRSNLTIPHPTLYLGEKEFKERKRLTLFGGGKFGIQRYHFFFCFLPFYVMEATARRSFIIVTSQVGKFFMFKTKNTISSSY